MPTLTPALAARRPEITTIRTPRTGSTHALSDTLDMMGAPMSFSRNEEIYGEAEPADYLYKVVSGAVRMYRVSMTVGARSARFTCLAICSAWSLGKISMLRLPRRLATLPSSSSSAVQYSRFRRATPMSPASSGK